nr:heterogeneous nuclear ribonucleoprotein hrp1 [Colletotrichum truncatum]KAF6794904.1 heterogeneous nuclear ribonucleoprotein hrp1 [Colletotrichum truncatum]
MLTKLVCRKMFIGGLNWETTDQSLRDYFTQFGEVVECTVMRDSSTGRSRGFGFLTFRDPKTVNVVMVKEHFLDGKIIDPKRAIPRDEQEKTSKIFVGGVSQDTTDQEFKDYFAQFGRVVDATLMMDKDTGRPRGFGFVTFESEAGVDACLSTSLEIHGKPIEVKKAQPRGNLREEEEAARRGGKFRKGEDSAAAQSGMGGNQMGATGGMTPQVMAQYFQRMQQAFAMMQQQMAMSRGMGPMNPAMMQQMMQMQQMQQMQSQMMGRGGGGNGQNMMGNMSPQMMQQMQQQMQQMQQMGGQQGGPPSGPSGSFSPQQQMFDPSQGGQPQQQPTGPRRGGSSGSGGAGREQYNQAAYGGMGGGGGGPTSWEGMYDDVPQPNMNPGGGRGGGFNRGQRGAHQGSPDPAHAPPANAPTGPKNAGKPGANYRGGGRSGTRGFHPYSR